MILRRFLTGGFMVLPVVWGCATGLPDRREPTVVHRWSCCQAASPTPMQRAVATTARRLIGARTIVSHGERIKADCAGVTRAIFLAHGIDLYKGDEAGPNANGVRLIYSHVEQYGRLHTGPSVRPGDVVFFDNTWDLNGDGLLNDALTHVGVVEGVESDGTVVFISRVSSGIQRYRMNLSMPDVHRAADGRVVNDYLRRKGFGDRAPRLAGQLFAGFGSVVR